jgi:CMP-N-acetylneuraminic acid synthetase
MPLGVLALIPARGGSKTIPLKNLVKVAGISLLERAVETCRRSLLGEPVVSTDSEEIGEECRRIGVVVLPRPSSLATDETPMAEVVCHALEQSVGTEAVCVLQPTNPLRSHHLINEALTIWEHDRPDSLACRVLVGDCHPGRMLWGDGSYLFPDLAELNRQQLPPVYHRDGSCYLVTAQTARRKTMIGQRHAWLDVERGKSWNVDDYVDLAICEALLSPP